MKFLQDIILLLAKKIVRPVKVAFVDDDPTFSTYITSQIKTFNDDPDKPFRIDVKTYLRGEDLEQELRSKHPPRFDHIFVDLHLNEPSTGRDFVKEWVSDGLISNTRVFILTAKFSKHPSPFVWGKPFSIKEFVSRLKEIMSADLLTNRVSVFRALHQEAHV